MFPDVTTPRPPPKKRRPEVVVSTVLDGIPTGKVVLEAASSVSLGISLQHLFETKYAIPNTENMPIITPEANKQALLAAIATPAVKVIAGRARPPVVRVAISNAAMNKLLAVINKAID